MIKWSKETNSKYFYFISSWSFKFQILYEECPSILLQFRPSCCSFKNLQLCNRAMQALQIDFKEPERKSQAEKLFSAILHSSSAFYPTAPSEAVDRGRPRSKLKSEEQKTGQTSSLDEVELALEPDSRRGEALHGQECPLAARGPDKKTLSESNIRSSKAGRTSYHACLVSRLVEKNIASV